MRFEDKFDDLPRRLRKAGVAPAWRVVAILMIIFASMFLLLALGLGIALALRPEEKTPVQTRMPNPVVIAGNNPPVIQQGPFVGANQAPEPPNPPYPVVADLQRQGPADVPGEPKAAARETARDRFLRLGQEQWTAPAGHHPYQVSPSPDGKYVAYVQDNVLMVGPVGGVMEQVLPGGWNIRAGQLPANVGPGNAPVIGRPGLHPASDLTWSEPGPWLYFADTEGNLNRFEVELHQLEPLPFHGDAPVPLPNEPGKLVFRRSRATPKLDLPGAPAAADPTEIVLGDVAERTVRVLIPESKDYWLPMAVSPDGKRLILASDHGLHTQPRRFRLFLLDLGKGQPAKPKPIGPASKYIAAVSWDRNAAACFYARSQEPIPPDGWDVDGLGSWAGVDLFRYDLNAAKETRLSRGGGFDAPVAVDDDLLFMAWRNDLVPASWRLYRAARTEVMTFAEKEPNPPARDREAWTQLLPEVLKDAGVKIEGNGDGLTAQAAAALAEAFGKRLRERFKTGPPSDLVGWERLHRELGALNLPLAARTQAALVLGACEGEYVRRRHGAVWQLSAGPMLAGSGLPAKPDEEDPFGMPFNPFEVARVRPSLSAWTGAQRYGNESVAAFRGTLRDALQKAAGRKLVLTNDPGAARKAAREQADPDLARGLDLLRRGQADEGERVLLAMMKRKPHDTNEFLALRVGEALFTHQRWEALRQLMEPRARQQPPSAIKYNLLGLALLEPDPKAAVVQFKTALRCNLYFGPAYFNLAQAYEKANDPDSAVLCLNRYLKLLPRGPLAEDAHRRLAGLNEQGNKQRFGPAGIGDPNPGGR